MVFVNGKFVRQRMTGVQRVAKELTSRMVDICVVSPKKTYGKVGFLIWEQFFIPLKLLFSKGVLWSPCNTGPLLKKNQVVTVHDAAVFDCPEGFSFFFKHWYRWLLPKLIKRVRHVMTDSQFSKNRLIEITGVNSDHISVVSCGVDEKFFIEEFAVDFKKKYGINTPYLFVVGSLDPRKNLKRLVYEIWPSVSERYPDYNLVIAGASGGAFKIVFDKDLPQDIHLLGYVDDEDLPSLYRGSEIFLFPSLYEGFGLPPLEAMASGTVVISSNSASLPEVVGDAGVLVDPLDSDGWVTAVCNILSSPEEKRVLEVRAVERARVFSWDNAALEVQKLLKVYS